MNGAGDTGVEGLNPSHIGFRDTVSPRGVPDEVVGHSVKSLLQVKERHVYRLFFSQCLSRSGMDCICGGRSRIGLAKWRLFSEAGLR